MLWITLDFVLAKESKHLKCSYQAYDEIRSMGALLLVLCCCLCVDTQISCFLSRRHTQHASMSVFRWTFCCGVFKCRQINRKYQAAFVFVCQSLSVLVVKSLFDKRAHDETQTVCTINSNPLKALIRKMHNIRCVCSVCVHRSVSVTTV